jgi:hypothetical protein
MGSTCVQIASFVASRSAARELQHFLADIRLAAKDSTDFVVSDLDNKPAETQDASSGHRGRGASRTRNKHKKSSS